MRDFLVWKKKHTKIYWIIETTKKQKKERKKADFYTQIQINSFITQKIKKNKKSPKNSKKSLKMNKNRRKKGIKCCLKEILSCYSLLKKHQKRYKVLKKKHTKIKAAESLRSCEIMKLLN